MVVLLLMSMVACKKTDIGDSCESVDDCFRRYDALELGGEPVCFTQIQGGYCSHTCEDDEACCAAGECEEGLVHICEAFESEDDATCFVSCEEEDGGAAVCDELGDGFECRNTGGGQGRKFCSP